MNEIKYTSIAGAKNFFYALIGLLFLFPFFFGLYIDFFLAKPNLFTPLVIFLRMTFLGLPGIYLLLMLSPRTIIFDDSGVGIQFLGFKFFFEWTSIKSINEHSFGWYKNWSRRLVIIDKKSNFLKTLFLSSQLSSFFFGDRVFNEIVGRFSERLKDRVVLYSGEKLLNKIKQRQIYLVKFFLLGILGVFLIFGFARPGYLSIFIPAFILFVIYMFYLVMKFVGIEEYIEIYKEIKTRDKAI